MVVQLRSHSCAGGHRAGHTGEKAPRSHKRTMLVLIWATLIFGVWSNDVNNTDRSPKPSLLIPSLTEGHNSTLTCTAPSHCSQSDPVFTWMWRGAGENNSVLMNDTTDQGQNSTWTFNPSAKHHRGEVTCVVNCTGEHNTTETLNVTYVKTPEITGGSTVKEGDVLNLTCTVDSFPPSAITWTKQNRSLTEKTERDLREHTGISTFIIYNVTAQESGQYFCKANHWINLTQGINITVIYAGKPEITGETAVTEGGVLNLTCSVDRSPPPVITWTRIGHNTTLGNGTGVATLVIFNVAANQSGQYICTAKHLDYTLIENVNVTVKARPKVLNDSVCKVQSAVLTCVCISEGFPVPTIKWPLLEDQTEYSIMITLSKHTVNSTITLAVKNHSNSTVECVSSNKNGDFKANLTIAKEEEEGGDDNRKLIKVISRLEMVIAFLIGTLFSSIVFCLAKICCRKKQRTLGNLAETLEMVTSQEDSLMNAGEAREDAEVEDQDTTEGAEADVAEKSDVEYSSVNFYMMKRKSPAQAGTSRGTPETEYAEIKKGEARGGAEVEGNEDGEIKHCDAEEEEGEDTALYSSVSDILGQN
ncbi:basement membrane-specific heparan sulfate proteoglycan core protein-like isoform X2 [Parambassis ranga]|uniref:Basement membrane-specific heparan sulfate proteoglycan core protein-like isoform X2 n=1 Tax=Parambassis ranga TaxID=210632 RepID=A0A6P7JUJ1_9TELE|nr:basement membrane-specific heparan sulfate proteoglycan core protein-like isoform X2 [Parambassis ranga]